MWNSIPSYVVMSDTINTFKNRIDAHWKHRDFLFHYRATYTGTNYGLFAATTNRSRERKFQMWNFRSLKLSHPGTFAPWNFRTLELSLPGTLVPTNEYNKERKF